MVDFWIRFSDGDTGGEVGDAGGEVGDAGGEVRDAGGKEVSTLKLVQNVIIYIECCYKINY